MTARGRVMAAMTSPRTDEEILRFAERAKQEREEQKEDIERFLSSFEKEYRARIDERKKVSTK